MCVYVIDVIYHTRGILCVREKWKREKKASGFTTILLFRRSLNHRLAWNRLNWFADQSVDCCCCCCCCCFAIAAVAVVVVVVVVVVAVFIVVSVCCCCCSCCCCCCCCCTHLLISILNGFPCNSGKKLNSFKQIALAALVQICRTRSIYSRIAREAIWYNVKMKWLISRCQW